VLTNFRKAELDTAEANRNAPRRGRNGAG
jgi:hypothetical protein